MAESVGASSKVPRLLPRSEDPDRLVQSWFWNGGEEGHACAMVAVEGARGDWSAYVGGGSSRSRQELVRKVMDRGAKLPRDVAEAAFPDFATSGLEWRK